MLNLDRHWQLKAAYHYLHTPFNNFKYNNHLLSVLNTWKLFRPAG
jgi:hypothetical protein